MIYKGANRQYKDRLFKFLFGNPENKAWTLSLYNAINGSHHTDPDEIRITTIEDAVYMGMKNDVSFLISNIMNLMEQHASFNPNLPMRFLIYAGMLYGKYVKNEPGYHEYSSAQQKAPTPRCICFYNGTAEIEDRRILRLSDAFEPGSKPDIEVTVTMININYGHNRELLEACNPLFEYSWFVERVRSNQTESEDLVKAIDKALAEMPDDFLIKPFILANQAEVKNMCITEYDEERTLAYLKEEFKAEGFLEALAGLVKDGLLSLTAAAERAGMSVPEFEVKGGLNVQS